MTHVGMGFHELLEVQQGDRRRYHDDVSIIIISLEGKIYGPRSMNFATTDHDIVMVE